jgi:hypothetical protein
MGTPNLYNMGAQQQSPTLVSTIIMTIVALALPSVNEVPEGFPCRLRVVLLQRVDRSHERRTHRFDAGDLEAVGRDGTSGQQRQGDDGE